MRDALKNYLSLATGVTEVTRQRAQSAAQALVAQGGAAAGQVQSLADDLIATSKANRELLTSLVRAEVDKTVSRVGLATADEVGRLTRRLQDVESSLRSRIGKPAKKAAAAKKTAAKKPAKKAAAAKPAKKTAAKKPAAKTAAKKTAAKKTAAKKKA